MKRKLFYYLIMIMLINFSILYGEYEWKRFDGIKGGYFKSFCQDSLGNVYITHTVTIKKSEDDGDTWNTIYIFPQNPFTNLPYIESSKNSILFIGGDSLLISKDQGATFINISPDKDTIKVSYSNLCIYDSTLFLFKNKYFYKRDDYISYLMYSKDFGNNWNVIDSFPGFDISITKGRTPIDLKVDKNGSLFFIVDSLFYFIKEINLKPKLILKHKYLPNAGQIATINKRIYLTFYNYIYEFITESEELVELPNYLGYVRELNYYNGIYYCIERGSLYESKDTMKSWDLITNMFSYQALLPKLFITSKGTLLVGDNMLGLYVGRKVNIIFERKERTIKISPNPAGEYIKINVETSLRHASTDKINIYNILGKCVLSEKIHPITQSYRMNIEHLPSGIYFVRLGDWVGNFVKIE